MKKLVLLTMFLSVSLCWAQEEQEEKVSIDKETSKLITQLETKGITNYFAAERSCDGKTQTYRLPDGSECTPEDTDVVRYVFWKSNNVTMMKQLDACGTSTTVALEDASLFDFYVENREDFIANKVKPFAIAGDEGTARLEVGDDNCSRFFMFKNNAGAFTQVHNIYYLTNAAKKPNVNYEYNNGLSIVALDKMIDEAIETVPSNGLWKRL